MDTEGALPGQKKKASKLHRKPALRMNKLPGPDSKQWNMYLNIQSKVYLLSSVIGDRKPPFNTRKGYIGLVLWVFNLCIQFGTDFYEATVVFHISWASAIGVYLIMFMVCTVFMIRHSIRWYLRIIRTLSKESIYYGTIEKLDFFFKLFPAVITVCSFAGAGAQYGCYAYDNALTISLDSDKNSSHTPIGATWIVTAWNVLRFTSLSHVYYMNFFILLFHIVIFYTVVHSQHEFNENMGIELKSHPPSMEFQEAVNKFAARTKLLYGVSENTSVVLATVILTTSIQFVVNAYNFLFIAHYAIYLWYAVVPLIWNVMPLIGGALVTSSYQKLKFIVIQSWVEIPEKYDEMWNEIVTSEKHDNNVYPNWGHFFPRKLKNRGSIIETNEKEEHNFEESFIASMNDSALNMNKHYHLSDDSDGTFPSRIPASRTRSCDYSTKVSRAPSFTRHSFSHLKVINQQRNLNVDIIDNEIDETDNSIYNSEGELFERESFLPKNRYLAVKPNLSSSLYISAPTLSKSYVAYNSVGGQAANDRVDTIEANHIQSKEKDFLNSIDAESRLPEFTWQSYRQKNFFKHWKKLCMEKRNTEIDDTEENSDDGVEEKQNGFIPQQRSLSISRRFSNRSSKYRSESISTNTFGNSRRSYNSREELISDDTGNDRVEELGTKCDRLENMQVLDYVPNGSCRHPFKRKLSRRESKINQWPKLNTLLKHRDSEVSTHDLSFDRLQSESYNRASVVGAIREDVKHAKSSHSKTSALINLSMPCISVEEFNSQEFEDEKVDESGTKTVASENKDTNSNSQFNKESLAKTVKRKFNYEKYIKFLELTLETVGFSLARVTLTWDRVSFFLAFLATLVGIFGQSAVLRFKKI